MKDRYYLFHQTIEHRKVPYGIYDAIGKVVTKSSIKGLDSTDTEIAKTALADLQTVLDILNNSNAVVVKERLAEKEKVAK